MAVITSDEAFEADELHYVNRELDVVLPLAGALREYNSIIVGHTDDETMKAFVGLSTEQARVLASFLNKLFRFPTDLVHSLLGAEFCSVSYFRQRFEAWVKDVAAGFKLDEVERQIASAFGLSCTKTIWELVVDDYNSIDFQLVDASDSPDARSVVVLSVRLKNAVRSEPLVIRLFENVEGFKQIDEATLVNAIQGMVQPPSKLAPTRRDELKGNKSSIVRFHAEQFAETADLIVDQISVVANKHEFRNRLLATDDPPVSDGFSSFIEHARKDQELMRAARDGEWLAVDQREWNQLSDLVNRLDALLANGDIHLLDCRSATRNVLSCFWEIFSPIAEPFRIGKCASQWPLITERDVKWLHSISRSLRNSEGIRFATPEEAKEWVHQTAWQKVKDEGLVKSKSEWLAHLLIQSRETAKSATDVCIELLLPEFRSPERVEASKPEERFNKQPSTQTATVGEESEVAKFDSIPKRERRGAAKEKLLKILRLIRRHNQERTAPLKLVLLARQSSLAESTIKSNYRPVLEHFGIKTHEDGGYYDPKVWQPSE